MSAIVISFWMPRSLSFPPGCNSPGSCLRLNSNAVAGEVDVLQSPLRIERSVIALESIRCKGSQAWPGTQTDPAVVLRKFTPTTRLARIFP